MQDRHVVWSAGPHASHPLVILFSSQSKRDPCRVNLPSRGGRYGSWHVRVLGTTTSYIDRVQIKKKAPQRTDPRGGHRCCMDGNSKCILRGSAVSSLGIASSTAVLCVVCSGLLMLVVAPRRISYVVSLELCMIAFGNESLDYHATLSF